MRKRTKTNQKRSTNSEVDRIKKDIRSLRDSGKSDIEIRETLGLELRNYQKYTKSIHEEDKQVWYDLASQELSSQLLSMKQSLEETYKIARDMALDPKCEDRLSALQSKDDARLSIIHLLSEYPVFVKAIQTQPLEESTGGNEIKESTLMRIH